MIDTRTVQAFLEDAHLAAAERLSDFCRREIAPLPVAQDDEAAREQARRILGLLGSAGILAPIDPLDLRGCLLARERLAWASPLADAVFALQTLSVIPLALAAPPTLRERWLPGALRGQYMGAFAMTEPEAGSDVGAITTRARRDGDDYVLTGEKTFISNAGIADFHIVFASTDPDAGRRGLSCFLVSADAPGLRFERAQVLSSPPPLGEIPFDGCRVPVEARLGRIGKARDVLRVGIEVARQQGDAHAAGDLGEFLASLGTAGE